LSAGAVGRSPPAQPQTVRPVDSASIPTYPAANDPSVTYVNWNTPFRKTSRAFPFAARRHLSPETISVEKVVTRSKFPSGFSLKMPHASGCSAHKDSSQPVYVRLLRSIRTIGPPPPPAIVPSVTSEYWFGEGAMLHAPVAL